MEGARGRCGSTARALSAASPGRWRCRRSRRTGPARRSRRRRRAPVPPIAPSRPISRVLRTTVTSSELVIENAATMTMKVSRKKIMFRSKLSTAWKSALDSNQVIASRAERQRGIEAARHFVRAGTGLDPDVVAVHLVPQAVEVLHQAQPGNHRRAVELLVADAKNTRDTDLARQQHLVHVGALQHERRIDTYLVADPHLQGIGQHHA